MEVGEERLRIQAAQGESDREAVLQSGYGALEVCQGLRPAAPLQRVRPGAALDEEAPEPAVEFGRGEEGAGEDVVGLEEGPSAFVSPAALLVE